jgi:CHAD domain-containing protein
MTFKNPFYLTPEKSSPDAREGRHFFVKGSLESGLRALPGLQLHRLQSESETCDFFDTHVWSLWFKKAILAREKDWLLQADGECLKIVSDASILKFASGFPEGQIRTRLGDLIDNRALRKTASVRLEREFLEVSDASGKPLAHLALCRITTIRSNMVRATMVQIFPSSKSSASHQMVNEALLAKGCRPSHENLVQVVYKLCRVRPEPYSLKLRLEFAPETHARTVVLEIFNNLLSIARWNEEGIIKDIDTEFLHDYRVSLRKLRSVTGQLKGVFPESLTTIWKNKVGEICRRTNVLRDYDVYILSRERLEGMVPGELRAGLRPFFERLKTKRHMEARKVADFLRSETYKNQVTSLQAAWGSASSIETAANSARPIREVAAERILKRFRRIRKASKGITTETPDAVIHSVRIDCKKMRYLLECFGHLFPAETVDPLARQLAKLQNVLGRFNDTSLQQKYLLQQAVGHLESGETRLALSLGGLIGSLHHEHSALRNKVSARLHRFARASNARRAASLSNTGKN